MSDTESPFKSDKELKEWGMQVVSSTDEDIPQLQRDFHGHLMIRGNCSVCKQCWIYLNHPEVAGKCIYGGPYSGYENQEAGKATEDGSLSSVSKDR